MLFAKRENKTNVYPYLMMFAVSFFALGMPKRSFAQCDVSSTTSPLTINFTETSNGSYSFPSQDFPQNGNLSEIVSGSASLKPIGIVANFWEGVGTGNGSLSNRNDTHGVGGPGHTVTVIEQASGSLGPGIVAVTGGPYVALSLDTTNCIFRLTLDYSIAGTVTNIGTLPPAKDGTIDGLVYGGSAFLSEAGTEFGGISFCPGSFSVIGGIASGTVDCHWPHKPWLDTKISWSTSPVAQSCVVNHVQPFATGESLSGLPTAMQASFSPTDAGGASVKLDTLAQSCGFKTFDWQQSINAWPKLFPLIGADGTEISAPPSFFDPPNGGYDYFFLPGSNGIFSVSVHAFPFYYDPVVVRTGCAIWTFAGSADSENPENSAPVTCVQPITSLDGFNLHFFDAPQIPQILPGEIMAFTTSLVGVRPDNTAAPVFCADHSGKTVPCTWSWESTYNTESGGIKSSNVLPVNVPGIGGITITSINGSRQVPPTISCAVNREVLWPPNNKTIVVMISGQAIAGTSSLVCGTYRVIDEYSKYNSTGNFSADLNGHYSFEVPLMASRNGSDRDGRHYRIALNIRDDVGNVGTCSTTVLVPHDQR